MISITKSIRQFLNILRQSSHLKDIFINLSGSTMASILGLFFFIIVSRSLGPSQFGLFSGLVAFSLLLADVFDLGISVSIPKFISRYDMTNSNHNIGRFLGLTFLTKIGLIIFICLIGFFFTTGFSKIIFNDGIPSYLFIISLIGAVILALFNFSGVALQARRRYLKFGISNILGNGSRVIFVIAIISTTKLSVQTGIIIYILGNLVAAVIGLIWLPLRILRFPTVEDVSKFFTFNRWLSIAVVFSAVYSRLDSVLLVKLDGPLQTGLYGAAGRITFVFPLLISALSGVWSARFSMIDNKVGANILLKKTLLTTVLVSFVILCMIPFASLIITIVFGSAFIGSVLPLQILFIAWTVFLLYVPATQYVIYFLGSSRLYALLTFIQFVVIVGLDFLLIPSKGATGAAVAFLIGNLITLLLTYMVAISTGKGVHQ